MNEGFPRSQQRLRAAPTPPNAADGLRLRVEGRATHPHALAHLAQGLANLDISIVSGAAEKHEGARWTVELAVDARGARRDPGSIDLARLLDTAPASVVDVPVCVVRHETTVLRDGSIDVHVDAVDQVGLLGALLRRFGMLSLFPQAIHIATVDGVARDRFVLRGAGDSAPSMEAVDRVDRMLARSYEASA